MHLDFDVISRSLPYLWKGFRLHGAADRDRDGRRPLLRHAAGAAAAVAVQGAAHGSPPGYVNLMRSIPLVLVIFWFFFLMPQVLQLVTGGERPPQIGAERTAIITFIMFEAAYFCEIMRAGIQSIPQGPGAFRPTRSGLTYGQAMRLVILPQAFRNMIPLLLTQTIILFQDTSLVYVISRHRFRRRRVEDRAARRPPDRDVPVRRRRLLRDLLHAVVRREAPAEEDRRHPLRGSTRHAHDRHRQRLQVVRPVPGADRLHDQGRQGRGDRRLRAVGLGQVDADQVRQRAGAVPEGPDHRRRHPGARPEDQPAEAACAGRAWCSSISSCSRTCRSPRT